MATIREALRYASEQVHDSDLPIFESFETLDRATGKVTFDQGLYETNEAKAKLASELADTLDLIEADSCDWEVLNGESGGHLKEHLSVWCRHHVPVESGTLLVKEFVWSYAPKQSALPTTVFTSVLEDCVMPLNTQIAVHYVPYVELTDKNVVHYYTLDDLQSKIPNITGDDDLDKTIAEALRNFIIYRK